MYVQQGWAKVDVWEKIAVGLASWILEIIIELKFSGLVYGT
jgi:hypothetical protein